MGTEGDGPGELGGRGVSCAERHGPQCRLKRTSMADAAIDAWLVPPHTRERQKRAADRRSRVMRLSALFEEFSQYFKVERGASHRSIDTYRRYFGYFLNFARFCRSRVCGGTSH